MNGRPLSALPGRQPAPARSWEDVLRSALRPEFAVEVVRPGPEDAVLFGPRCAVAGCLAPRWRAAGASVAARRGAEPAPPARGARLRGRRLPAVGQRPRALLRALGHWQRAGRPALQSFATSAPKVKTEASTCTVTGCRFATAGGSPLCDTHLKSFRWLRTRRPGLEPADYLAHLTRARESASPTFDLRGLSELVRLELGYALQARSDARGAAITPPIFGQVVRWLGDRPVDSLLIGSDAAWARAAEQRFTTGARANPLGWVRFCRTVLQRLREQHAGREVWEWDTWPTNAIMSTAATPTSRSGASTSPTSNRRG